MAMMTPLQQRLLMERLRRDPRMAALIAARQQGGGGLAELAGLPQGAANLAEIAGLAPEPQVVTPAQPAPVEPGVELKIPDKLAPDDTPLDLRTAQERAREQTQRAAEMTPESQAAYGSMVEGKTPAQIAAEAKAKAGETRSPLQEAIAAARERAVLAEAERKLSPEEEAFYGKRAARYEENLANLGVEDKRAGWKALALGSMKMAQSREPYFASAFAAGLEAGLTGFDAAKMERAERKARLQAAQEQIGLDQVLAKRANYDREVARQAAFRQGIKDELSLMDTGLASQLARQIFPYQAQVQGPLAVQETQAGIDEKLARAFNYTQTPPPTGALTDNARLSAKLNLDKQILQQQAIIADPMKTKQEKDQAKQAIVGLQRSLSELGLGGSSGPSMIAKIEPVTEGGGKQRSAGGEQPAPAKSERAAEKPPKPKQQTKTPEQRQAEAQAEVDRALAQARRERQQYEKLNTGNVGLYTSWKEKGDWRRSNNEAFEAARKSGLPQYAKKPGESSIEYERRIRKLLKIPNVR